MSTEIHAMKTVDGWVYRLWQNTADVYFTEPLEAEDIMEAYIADVIERLKSRLPSILANARRDPLKAWDEEDTSWDSWRTVVEDS